MISTEAVGINVNLSFLSYSRKGIYSDLITKQIMSLSTEALKWML